jgi:hypothetical protein
MQESSDKGVNNEQVQGSSSAASTSARQNNTDKMTDAQVRLAATRTAQVASTMVQQAHKLNAHCQQSCQSIQTWRQKLVSVVVELREQSLSVSHLEGDLRKRSEDYATRLAQVTGLAATASQPLHAIFEQLRQVPVEDWIKGSGSSSHEDVSAMDDATKMSLFDYVDADAVLSLEQQASDCEAEMDAIVSTSALSASEIGSRLLRLFSMTRTIFATSGTDEEGDDDGRNEDDAVGSLSSSTSIGRPATSDSAAYLAESSIGDGEQQSDTKRGDSGSLELDIDDSERVAAAAAAVGDGSSEAEAEGDSVQSRVVRLSVTSVSESLSGIQNLQVGDTMSDSEGESADKLRSHPFQGAERAMETWVVESQNALDKLEQEVEYMTKLETVLLDVVRAIDANNGDLDSQIVTEARVRLQGMLADHPQMVGDDVVAGATQATQTAGTDDDGLSTTASVLEDANALLVSCLRRIAALTQVVGRSAKAMQNAKQTLQVSLLPSLDGLAVTAGERLAHADEMHSKFVELERRLPLLVEEINNLAVFYTQFVSAHGNIETEIFRRWHALARMEETAREQQQVLAQMYNQELQEREQFYEQHGQFLPQTLCRALGAHLQPTTFQYFPVNPEDATLLYNSISRKQQLEGLSASQLDLPPNLAVPSDVIGGAWGGLVGGELSGDRGGGGGGGDPSELQQGGLAFQLPPPASE